MTFLFHVSLKVNKRNAQSRVTNSFRTVEINSQNTVVFTENSRILSFTLTHSNSVLKSVLRQADIRFCNQGIIHEFLTALTGTQTGLTQVNPVHNLPPCVPETHFNTIPHLRLGLPCVFLSSGIPTKITHTFLICHTRPRLSCRLVPRD
jgi:hypothetical protein